MRGFRKCRFLKNDARRRGADIAGFCEEVAWMRFLVSGSEKYEFLQNDAQRRDGDTSDCLPVVS